MGTAVGKWFRTDSSFPRKSGHKLMFISKQKNVGPQFKSYFGKASEIPLRQEGYIRGAGPFPDAPEFGFPEMKAKDWAMCRNEDKSKRLSGAWVK